MRTYLIRLIHRFQDWDAEFKFQAPSAKKMKEWALLKLAAPNDWLVTSCTVVGDDEASTTSQRDALGHVLADVLKSLGDANTALSALALSEDTKNAVLDGKKACHVICGAQATARLGIKRNLPANVQKALKVK